jgi:hypothetical protein
VAARLGDAERLAMLYRRTARLLSDRLHDIPAAREVWLKLLELDSSLNARKELAQELNVNAGSHGSAEQNIALHEAVMRKVAENGARYGSQWKTLKALTRRP